MSDLVVKGACGSGFLSCIVPRSDPWHIRIDLTWMRFCEPLGLVAIAAFAENAIRRGERVVVQGPSDTNVANYLSRMRLGTVLAALGAEHNLPSVREHDVGDALFELTTFDGARGAGALARAVHAIVEPYDLEAANALHDGVCEAGQNVAHHSGQSRGFLAAQRTHHGSRLYFAVSDSGDGLLATLRTRGAVDDVDALDRALKPGVTRTDDLSRGNGLSDMVDQVRDLRGAMHLMSGSAIVTAVGHRRSYASSAGTFQGTVVQGMVRPSAPVA